MFFGAEPELQQQLVTVETAARGEVRAVLLILERARNPDAAFLSLLKKLEGNLRQRNISLLLCGVEADMGKALAGTGLEARIGADRIFSDRPNHDQSRRDAIQAAYDLLGENLCPGCPRRKENAAAYQPWDYSI